MQRQPEPEYMDLDDEAEAYARADFAEVNQAFAERLAELAGDRQGVHALDLGTGPGDIPIRVLRLRPDWHITGLDASKAMLDWAAQAVDDEDLSRSIGLVLGDAKCLPLRSQAFDVVFSNSILHHITAAAPFWREVKRVAAPGAVILVRDLARPADKATARRIVEQYSGQESALLKEEFYRSLLSAYTVEEVRGQLRQAGLDGLQVAMASDRHLDVFGAMK